MAEKDKITETKVKHDGLFDFKELYKFMYTMLTDDEYEVEEKSYSEKNGANGKEIEVHWVAKRKISDYFRYVIKVDTFVLGLNSVEVTREGSKAKTNKGSLEIKFSAYIEKDYESKWETAPLLKFLRGVYDRYVIKNRISDNKLEITKDMNKWAEQSKAFLVLEARK